MARARHPLPRPSSWPYSVSKVMIVVLSEVVNKGETLGRLPCLSAQSICSTRRIILSKFDVSAHLARMSSDEVVIPPICPRSNRNSHSLFYELAGISTSVSWQLAMRQRFVSRILCLHQLKAHLVAIEGNVRCHGQGTTDSWVVLVRDDHTQHGLPLLS